ncbi:MAG TPA: hypothetical protein VKM55_02915 [Candidatus Lokiarchaeia archaeon]|nr:hypothetical protein [Candidatus Lokiarchaeia archaeon]
MIQADLYIAGTTIIVPLIILSCVVEITLHAHRGSIDKKRQLSRLISFACLLCSIMGTLFILISFQFQTTTVHVQRIYEDPAIDSESLTRAETFNYTEVVGALPEPLDVFPPYHYENKSWFKPFGALLGQPSASIYYDANITHPNATLNITARIRSTFLNLYQNLSIGVMLNGTWHHFNETHLLIANITWLADIRYSLSNNSYFQDVHMIVGLNASRDVILIVRGFVTLYAACACTTTPAFFSYIPIGGMFIALSIFIVIEVNYGRQTLKRPQRRITAENVMENETRQEIVRIVHDYPGITFSAIKRQVLLSPRTVLEQLGILQRFGVIRARDIRHNTVFFGTGTNEKQDLLLYFVANDKFRAILKALQLSPRIDFITLQARVNASRSTLMRKIRILEKFGIISITRTSGRLTAIDIDDGLRNARGLSADGRSN